MTEIQKVTLICLLAGIALALLAHWYERQRDTVDEGGTSYIYCPKCFIRMNGKNHQPYLYDDDDMVVYSCSCGCKSRWDLNAPCPLLLWSSQ